MTRMGRPPGPRVQRVVGERESNPLRGISSHIRATVRPGDGCATCAHHVSRKSFMQADLARLARRASGLRNGPGPALLADLAATKAGIAEETRLLAEHRESAHPAP